MTPAHKVADPDVSRELIDAIQALPVRRDVTHCGTAFQVSPFAFYAVCPACGARVKLRSFAAVPELEDVFEAVFAWMNQPGAEAAARDRRAEIAADPD